jgi:hypothetical protein
MKFKIITIPFDVERKSFFEDDLNNFCINKQIKRYQPEFFMENGKAASLLSRKISRTGQTCQKGHLFPMLVALSKMSGTIFPKKFFFCYYFIEAGTRQTG